MSFLDTEVKVIHLTQKQMIDRAGEDVLGHIEHTDTILIRKDISVDLYVRVLFHYRKMLEH